MKIERNNIKMIELLDNFITWFRFTGVAPFTLHINDCELERNKPNCVLNITLLIAYLIGTGFYIQNYHDQDGLISNVLAHIQLAANTISFAIIIIVPIKNVHIMKSIAKKFVKIDNILNDNNSKGNEIKDMKNYSDITMGDNISTSSVNSTVTNINNNMNTLINNRINSSDNSGSSILYTLCLREFKIVFYVASIHLITLVILNFYATVIDSKMSLVDWIIIISPLVWSSFIIAQVGILILWLYHRSESINQILWSIERSFALNRTLSSNVANISFKVSPTSCNIRSIAKHLSNVFQALNEICDLVNEIENYYGLIFLSSFAAIFIESAIRIYSAFTFIICYDTFSTPPSIWIIICCILTGLTCIAIIFGITTACERLTNGVSII